MTITRALGIVFLWLAPFDSSAAETAAARTEKAACAVLRSATAQVNDIDGGVALSLRVAGSELDVITLRDFVGHVVNAWNEAEHGITQRCAPRIKTSAGEALLASTAETRPILDGVEVLFKPVDLAQLPILRKHVHRRGAHTLACACAPRRPGVRAADSLAACARPSFDANERVAGGIAVARCGS